MWPKGYLIARKRELQAFLQRCCVIPYIKDEDVFIYFLQKHGNEDSFEKPRKTYDKSNKKPKVDECLKKLKTNFPDIIDIELPEDMSVRCVKSKEFIDTSINQLTNLIKSMESYVHTYSQLNECLKEINDLCLNLETFEDSGQLPTTNATDETGSLEIPQTIPKPQNLEKYKRIAVSNTINHWLLFYFVIIAFA